MSCANLFLQISKDQVCLLTTIFIKTKGIWTSKWVSKEWKLYVGYALRGKGQFDALTYT